VGGGGEGGVNGEKKGGKEWKELEWGGGGVE
jgi:hypothetical protein